jgi:lipopolysaccharide/colanic/teichoic acid biosynthesis glycosyltransferase
MRRVARFLSYGGGALAVLALSLYHGARIADPPYDFTGTSRFGWAIGYSILLGVAAYAVGLPDQPSNKRQAAWLATVAAAIAAIGVSVPQLLLGDALLPRFVVFGAAVLSTPWQVAINALSRDGQSRAEDRDRVLLVADQAEHERLVDDLAMELERGATLVATLDPASAGGTEPGHEPLLAAHERSRASVVVMDRVAAADDRVIAQAAKLHEAGVRVRTLQGFYEEWLGKLPLSELERASLFFDIGEVHRARYGRLKRIMDLTLALAGLVPLALMTPVVLAGNLVANRGPLLYRQTRVGKGGEHFTIYKFRTMRTDEPDADELARGAAEPPVSRTQGDRWTEVDDPRVTPWGRVLRRTHLDELPQVLNILRGDLSVVGPRPEQPHYVAELSDKLAFYDLRHLVRPGLTGWAQVKYGYAGDERDALEKLQYEFFYLRHQDLTFDQRIILRTLRATIGGRGSGR